MPLENKSKLTEFRVSHFVVTTKSNFLLVESESDIEITCVLLDITKLTPNDDG